jgi:hypothetical protein
MADGVDIGYDHLDAIVISPDVLSIYYKAAR